MINRPLLAHFKNIYILGELFSTKIKQNPLQKNVIHVFNLFLYTKINGTFLKLITNIKVYIYMKLLYLELTKVEYSSK